MTNKPRLYSLTQLYEIEKADDDFILTVINVFLEFIPLNGNELVNACATEDWDTVYFIAHKLKANVKLLNIDSIKEEVIFIESSAKAKTNLEQLAERAQLVNNTLRQVAAQMKEDFNL